MDEMAFGGRALPFEGLRVLEGIKRVARAVPEDDRKANRVHHLGAEVQEHWIGRRVDAFHCMHGHIALLKCGRPGAPVGARACLGDEE